MIEQEPISLMSFLYTVYHLLTYIRLNSALRATHLASAIPPFESSTPALCCSLRLLCKAAS